MKLLLATVAATLIAGSAFAGDDAVFEDQG
jgi:hypothetical protein